MAGKRVEINILPTATGGLPPPANLTMDHDPQILPIYPLQKKGRFPIAGFTGACFRLGEREKPLVTP